MRSSDSSVVLLVRHGPGRGRISSYNQPLLEHLASTAPALYARLRLHETGAEPPRLDDVRAVVFWLGDPLRERYPECFAHASEIAGRARLLGIPIVNAPEALSNTIKSVQARRWCDAGIPCAPSIRCDDADALRRAVDAAAYPIFVRADLLHAQRQMTVYRTRADAEALLRGPLTFPLVVVGFVDTRADYAALGSSVWSRLYHKRRAFVLGDEVLAYHIYFSADPIVGGAASTCSRYAGRRRHLAPLARILPLDRACLAADYDYWRAAPPHAELLRRATRALDLDYVAIDYAVRADGTAVLWEANPYPFIPREWHQMPLARERRLAQRIPALFTSVGGYFERLLAGTPSAVAVM